MVLSCKNFWNYPRPMNANCGIKRQTCFQTDKNISSYCCHGICGIFLQGGMCLSHQTVYSMFFFTLFPFWFLVYSNVLSRCDEGFMTFLWHEDDTINSHLSFRMLSAAVASLTCFHWSDQTAMEIFFYIAIPNIPNHKLYRSETWIYSFLVFIYPMAVTIWLRSSGKQLVIFKGCTSYWIDDFYHIPFTL